MSYGRIKGGRQTSPALLYLLVAVAALLVIPGVARADHPNDTEVTAALGEKPQQLDGVTVQVQDTQGPQLVVENTTDETLEIHDAEGTPFLRIGPDGVEGNRSASAFYETYGPEGIPPPEDVGENPEEAEADWQRVSDQRSWGWFDQRLQTEDVDVPEDIAHDGEAADFGEWEVPVGLGDTETSLQGSYRYEPEPEGAYVADLTSEPQLSRVETQLSQGYGGATALLLQNEGEDPVTVLDGEGEPAIEIGPDEVRVNMSSPVGREANRSAGTAGTTAGATSGDNQQDGDTEQQPRWEAIAGGSSFTWQDPRLRPPDGQSQPPNSDAGKSQEVAQWEIPLQSSGESSSIRGAIEWEPLEGESGAGEPGAGGATTGSGGSGHDHSSHDHSGQDHSGDSHASAGSGNDGSSSENVSAGDVHEARLDELNGSGVSGSGRVEFEEDNRVSITVDASELEPEQTHQLHIHGLDSSEEATCPPGDEAVHHEMEDAVGQHALNLEPYPEADGEGNMTFEGTFPQAEGALVPLEDKALVVHGMDADGGYDQQVPVACGEFGPANNESVSTRTALLGMAGGNGIMLYGLLGLAALALPAAGFAILRRR